MQSQPRSPSIDFLRFLFMLVIVLWHFARVNPFTHGYIAVDFFFILSGFLLYKSYCRHRITPFDYTVRKLRRLYPKYLLVFLGAIFLKTKIWIKGDVITTLMNSLSEMFLIHSVGVYSSGINPPSWYISVLIVGGALLYAIVYINRNVAINLLCPLVVLLGYTYLFGFNGSLEQFSVDGCISQPLLRGVSGMSLGAVLSAFVGRTASYWKNHKKLINITSVLSLILIGVVLFSSSHYDKFALIAFSIIVFSCNLSFASDF